MLTKIGNKKIMTFSGKKFDVLEDLLNKCIDRWGEKATVGTFTTYEEEILAVVLIKDEETADKIEYVLSKGIHACKKELHSGN